MLESKRVGRLYAVHFWGGIDLACDPAGEYARLRANGYPLVIYNIPTRIGVGWDATAVR